MTKDTLRKWLDEYFDINSEDGSYTYELTRVKSAFDVGTMTMDDFVEWDTPEVDNLVEFLWNKLNNKEDENNRTRIS